MLFRSNTGELIEIKKYDFPNDKLYYKKIMEIKKPLISLTKTKNFFNQNMSLPKLEKTFNNKNN
jgi:hypothetical protein